MIETPPSFAATPDIDRGGDLLADMLRSIRLSGSVFLNASLTEPFGLISPKHFDERTPMAHLRHVSIFHLIAAGECTVELASGERGTIAAGDVLLMPFADTHRFYSGGGAELCSAMELVRAGPLSGMWTIEHGGGGRETRMVCGFIESSELLHSPVFRTLPPMLIDRAGDDKVSAILATTVREILSLTEDATPGSEIMLGRLMELLFVEVLRRYAAGLPPSAHGWFAALNDPGARTRDVACPRKSRSSLDGRRSGPRMRHVAHGARRALQRGVGPGSDRICDQLADAVGSGAHANGWRQSCCHRQRRGLRSWRRPSIAPSSA